MMYEPYIMDPEAVKGYWRPISDEENLANAMSLLKPLDPSLERKRIVLQDYHVVEKMIKDEKNYTGYKEYWPNTNQMSQITIYHNHDRIVYIYLPPKISLPPSDSVPKPKIKNRLKKASESNNKITDFF